jgi:predicted nucleic acid-binding Zn ribbon protein
MQNVHGMQPVGAELERIVARSVRKAPPGEGPLLAWPLVCGSAVAERTRALEFAGGVLRVEVANAGWRTELQALAPRYVAVINKYVAENVARVEFIVTSRK